MTKIRVLLSDTGSIAWLLPRVAGFPETVEKSNTLRLAYHSVYDCLSGTPAALFYFLDICQPTFIIITRAFRWRMRRLIFLRYVATGHDLNHLPIALSFFQSLLLALTHSGYAVLH